MEIIYIILLLQIRELALYRVKIDGSDEGIVVPVGDYEIHKDKVYFQNSKDVKKHIIGMYYSADLDGSNVKKLSDEACDFLMIYNDRIYYSSYKAIDNPLSMQLYSMKLDGGDVRKESVLMDDYARKFTNNYHLGKIGQKVNQVTTAIDKNKKQFRNSSWGMTLAEVLKAEGLQKPFSYDYIQIPGKLYGKNVDLEMRFDGEGKFHSGVYIIRIANFIPEGTAKDMTYLYEKANKDLTGKYGKPIKLGHNYYEWNVGDTKITLRCSTDLGHAPVFFLNYSRLDQEGAYKLPPQPMTISSTQNKNSNLDLLKQHLQYQNTGEGWAYYSGQKDNSTQDIIVSSEDLIHPELDAVVSIQHFGKQKTDIRNVLRETLKFYFPKDYQAVYKMVEETYPEEKLANSYHDKIFDTSLRHMLQILEENYAPKIDGNPYLNKTYNFDNKTVEFKVNKDYGMLEIYIGK